MSDEQSSDEYTEDTRAFHRRSSMTPGLEESESDSESDIHDEDSDKSEGAKSPAEDPNTRWRRRRSGGPN